MVLGLLGAAGAYAYDWSQRQYYVAPDGDKVAIFRGLPQRLGPINLSSVKETSDIDVANLPDYYRQLVERTIPATGDAAAEQQIIELRNQANACMTRRAQGIPCGSGQT